MAYERRISFDGRIGIAFHRTMESLAKRPPRGTTREIAEEMRGRFDKELKAQAVEADKCPREKGLPRNVARTHGAVEALIMSGRHFGKEPAIGYRRGCRPAGEPRGTPDLTVEVEVPVSGQAGLFSGRIDRVEHRPEGARLLDYKSALRVDLPERYERQVKLYAAMWYETRGAWPASAAVVYPLTGTSYEIRVTPEGCQRVVDESIQLIKAVEKERSPFSLAGPGDSCQVCEFRPWCKPFWQWQAKERNPSVALERAFMGFEGELEQLEQISHFWRLTLRWRHAQVKIVAPVERFPQLRRANVGERLRVLDMQLKGLRHQPKAVVSEPSEIFLLAKP